MPSGKAYLSRVVLYEKVGDGPVRCHWCRRSLRWLPKGQQRGIEADHLDGDTTNDDPSNLVASCARCNSNRGKGILWFTLQAVPGADMGEVYRWGPLKAEFPCEHHEDQAPRARLSGLPPPTWSRLLEEQKGWDRSPSPPIA
jgi:hypothetical protein